MSQGIYQILCIPSGKRYIGSSKNIEKRWNSHISELNKGRHHNYFLQKAWILYGESNFIFSLIEEVKNEKDLFKIERRYIKKFNFQKLFNIMKEPGAVPKRESKWTKRCKKKKATEKEFAWGE